MDIKRRPIIVGNWKMNGLTNFIEDLAGALANKFARKNSSHPFDMLICPPTTLLYPIGKIISETGLCLGGQDCHMSKSGAHTGDVSAEMLKDLGCSYVILGHSERRTDHNETNEIVKRKVQAALDANLISIICVGESAVERKHGVTADVVTSQILACIPQNATADNIVIAYEPIWAIGTGDTPTSKEVQSIHALIRQILGEKISIDMAKRTRVLYGGSVKPSNSVELMGLSDVDGALVGGASLSETDFWDIAKSYTK